MTQQYDSFTEEQQAQIRAVWKKRMEQLRSDLRLDLQFIRQGRPWVELDENEQVIRREPPADAC